MNYYKGNHWNKLPFIILLLLVGVISCNFKRAAQTRNVPSIDMAQMDSVRIIYTDDESKQGVVPPEAWDEINRLLQTANYDTVWNDSGIMLTMIAQDYALIISYKDRPSTENDWLLIWEIHEKIKFRNKWYIVDAVTKNELCKKIEQWR
ncbi:MAG: hypothetical protein LIP01_16180 [Tannerellaceae bacterium]|nr:hypothetical protein [Tannerellaceae bacterium]